MNVKIILFALVFSLLAALPAYAQVDFSASSLPIIEVCPCSNQQYQITVENSGSEAAQYRIVASGDAATWVSFSPQRFIVAPNTIGLVTATVNSVCNIEGVANLTVFVVEESTETTQTFNQQILFNNCYQYDLSAGQEIYTNVTNQSDFDFEAHGNQYDLCTDEKVSIPLLLENQESFENRYTFVVSSPEWVNFGLQTVQLGANQSGIAPLQIDTDGILGEHEVIVNTVSTLGKVQRELLLSLNVEDCNVFTVGTEVLDNQICATEAQEFDIYIDNVGARAQTISLSTDNGFVTIEDNELLVAADQQAIKKLTINAPDGSAGQYDLTITLESDGKEFSKQAAFEVLEHDQCYRADIDTRTKVTNTYEPNFVYASVTNAGELSTTFDITIDAPDWVTLVPEELELNPEQSGNVNLQIEPSEDVQAGSYPVVLTVTSNNETYTETITVVLKAPSEALLTFWGTVQFYEYYIYILIALIIVAVVVFMLWKRNKKGQEKKEEKPKEKSAKKTERKKSEKKVSDMPGPIKLLQSKVFGTIVFYVVVLTTIGILLFAQFGLMSREMISFGILAILAIAVHVLISVLNAKK